MDWYFGNYSETRIANGGKVWVSRPQEDRPLEIMELEWALNALTENDPAAPFEHGRVLQDSIYQSDQENSKRTHADCVRSRDPRSEAIKCVDLKYGGPIAISDNYGTYNYPKYLQYGTKMFPSRIEAFENGKLALAADLAISQPSSAADQFIPPAGAQQQAPQRVRVSQGVSKNNRVYDVAPVYPLLAREERRHGTVIFQAIIARDGSIKFLHVIQSAGADLDKAAADAVSKWRYKPYMINGAPVEVDTMITVNFRLQ